ncbi:MAG: response regulator [Bdellovibrionota bacterium]
MVSGRDSAEAKAFAKYIETRKILIADPSASARSGLFKVFNDLGAKTSQITLVNSFKQGVEQITALKPHIVVAEYELGRRCGLDLLQAQREQDPGTAKQMIFVIATANTSQTAVAKAAEEDIDAYIIKPFTVEIVRKTLMKAAFSKLHPSPYLAAIDAGKASLEEGRLDEAENQFAKAITLDPAPALAYYYLGQVKFIRKITEEARGSYSQGLEYNKIHYKCLVGLYELLMAQRDHSQAYEVVKKISQYFPANPKRLGEVLRLAIMNAKYEDVERYYGIFINIDERDDILIKYICAALVVCGRYYLEAGSRIRALELFQKAAATGTGRVKILREIVQVLVDHGLAKEARNFLNKFPAESHTSEDYLIMRFQILNLEGNHSLLISEGRDLLAKGLRDPRLFTIMLNRSAEANLDMAVDNIYNDAIRFFPERKTEFEELYQAAKNKPKGPKNSNA